MTERMILYKDAVCEMVIDKNTYLNKTDYELEIEYAEGHESKARSLFSKLVADLMPVHLNITLDELMISRAGKSKSKSESFLKQKLKKLN